MKPMHPNGCGGCWPTKPSCAAANCGCCARPGMGYLLPRILASGREWLRCVETTLQVEGLPECAQTTFRLEAVWVAGEATWTQQCNERQRTMCLHVRIPLCCQVEDGCGCVHQGRAWLEVDTALKLAMPSAECWRGSVIVLPCVRLVRAGCARPNGCFDVQLEVCLESYLVRWERVCAPQQNDCPPMPPLYPQPCIPCGRDKMW